MIQHELLRRLVVISSEWRLTAQQFDQEYPERPPVDSGPVLLLPNELRRLVERRAHDDAPTLRERRREAKVGEHQVTVWSDEQIVGFEISVCEVSLVHGAEAEDDHRSVHARIRRTQPMPRLTTEQLEQIAPRTEWEEHSKIGTASWRVADLEWREDEGVVEARHELRLRAQVRVRRRVQLGARLEREERPTLAVAQQVDLGKGAAAEDADGFVVGVELTRGVGEIKLPGRQTLRTGGRNSTAARALALRHMPCFVLHNVFRGILYSSSLILCYCT